MKKLVSLLSAVAVAASSFVALATVSYAAEVAADSHPEINIVFGEYTPEDGAIFYADLVNNEALSYTTGSAGRITANTINVIEVHVTLDTTVFDVSTSVAWPEDGSVVSSTSGDETAEITYLYSPTAVAGYMNTVPEHLFGIAAALQSGYTEENIPNDAMTITSAIVEYTHYQNVKPANGATHYTIYGYNVPTKDYNLTVSFTGTASSNPVDDPEFEAVIDENGIVTFNNTELSSETPSAILDTHDVKVFENKFSGVTADTRFDITHGGVTKTFGWTLGEYFGITGSGTLEGTLGVAVLFPKGDTNDFEITMK